MHVSNLKGRVALRCINEFLMGAFVSVSFAAILFFIIFEDEVKTGGELTAFYLLI